MQLTFIQRGRLWTAAALVMAVFLGVQIANEAFFWPGLVAGVLASIAIVYLQPHKIGTLLIGFVLLGYIIGNRGFAQFSPVANVPILPGEFAIAIAGSILLFKWITKKVSPIPREFLNIALFAWMAFSSLRFLYDLHVFGLYALRDFATIYYATFFYLAQDAGSTGRERSFLQWALLVALGVLLLISPFYERFPDFFTSRLLIRGTPIIYWKGDLVGTFAAAGTLVFFSRYERRGSWWALIFCLGLGALAATTNNRSSTVGIIVVSIILMACGRWKYVTIMAAAAALAMVAFLVVAFARNKPWQETPVYEAYERMTSLADPSGQGNYSGEDTYYKGDNNAFRWIWWKLTIEDTLHTNPVLGLGWGYDLAEKFERVYYPEGSDEFSARSPHSIYMTVFGRTGFLGLVPFLILTVAIIRKGVQAIRADNEGAYVWTAAIVILTSASFGVVLEGPMGAVVFWSILGLASSYTVFKDPAPALAAPSEISA